VCVHIYIRIKGISCTVDMYVYTHTHYNTAQQCLQVCVYMPKPSTLKPSTLISSSSWSSCALGSACSCPILLAITALPSCAFPSVFISDDDKWILLIERHRAISQVLNISMNTCIHTCYIINTYIQSYIHTSMNANIHAHMHTCTHAHMHTCTHTRTHTHTHTHTRTFSARYHFPSLRFRV